MLHYWRLVSFASVVKVPGIAAFRILPGGQAGRYRGKMFSARR